LARKADSFCTSILARSYGSTARRLAGAWPSHSSISAGAATENKKAAHGLRKVGATRAADNGATVAELEAIFGWRGGGMAALYTEEANRKKLSIEAGERKANFYSLTF
jgi:hypothetical protein